MQQRDFVATDIAQQQFYRVHEVVGGWGESRYIVKLLDDAELKRLCDENNRYISDTVATLVNTEQIEKFVEEDLRKEITDGVQTFQYQKYPIFFQRTYML